MPNKYGCFRFLRNEVTMRYLSILFSFKKKLNQINTFILIVTTKKQGWWSKILVEVLKISFEISQISVQKSRNFEHFGRNLNYFNRNLYHFG